MEVDDKMRLCTRDKESDNAMQMFMDRARLHKSGYQHKTVKVMDRIKLDVMLLADPYLALLGWDNKGRIIQMSKASKEVGNLAKLWNDFIVRSQHSTALQLESARNLMKQMNRRIKATENDTV